MSASERPVITEEERLARHILENEGDGLETRNEVRKHVLEGPVSHYDCVWAGDDPIIPAWENVGKLQETFERPPDHIGCTHCGVMTSMDDTLMGREIWQNYILNHENTEAWENYEGPKYIL